MSEAAKTPRKKSEVRQRQHVKSFRLSKEELEGFESNCENDNLSPTDYFRVHCCSQKPLRKQKRTSPESKQLASILAQLGKYGSNLNQIAHSLNITKLEQNYSGDDILKKLNIYSSQINELQTAIYECRALVRAALTAYDTFR